MITNHCINTQQICEKIHEQGKWKRVLAEQITLQNPNLAVWGSSLACRVVSLGKELYSTLCLFIQVYKWAQATYCWGEGNHVMDWHPVQGEVAIHLDMLHAKETRISSSHVGLWLVCPLTIHVQNVHVFHWLISTPLYKTLAPLGSFSNNPSQKKTGDISVTSQISSTAFTHLYRFKHVDLHVFNLFKLNRGLWKKIHKNYKFKFAFLY